MASRAAPRYCGDRSGTDSPQNTCGPVAVIREAEVGVHVDLADCLGCRFTQHLFRDADCVGHLAAVLVDHLHKLREDRGGAVQNDREARQAVGNFLKDIKAQLRLLAGFELVSTVARADCNGKGVHACPCYKILYLVRIRELCFVVFYLDVVLNASEFGRARPLP